MSDLVSNIWTVTSADVGITVGAFVRTRLDRPWSEVKRWIATGKLFADGKRVESEGQRVGLGQKIELRMTAPRPRDAANEVRIVFEDTHLVVIDKPPGVSSVPYDDKETGTAMDLLREAWRLKGRAATTTALHTVHRIDKDTSGLLVFAKSKRAEIALAAQFRDHSIERAYTCVAHGVVLARRIESHLLDDRGDGIRGSARHPDQGKRAVTHVKPLEALAGATLCEVRLETGKTHQIRIHLAESGHPLVGETVYSRDFIRDGKPLIEAPRLLLHAATLGFVHPHTGEPQSFKSDLPESFTREVARLRLVPAKR